MLPESSIVSMMFGFTGFSPWIGTCASVGVIVAATTTAGWKASTTARTVAQHLANADWRKVVIVWLLNNSRRREAYLSMACA